MLKVIVPVYKGIEDTQECLDAVVDSKSRNSTLFQVIVINDCSPDPEIDALLKGYSDKGAIHLIKHKENQGFVRSVNEGMRHDHSSDVVLLNSDAIAANDWLDRLWRCAYSDNGIGTVTPFSNNATICSFPDFCRENKVLKGFSVAEIDNAFSNANKGGVVEIPTAVGFCVYIKRKCIDEVGLFNETAFGRGYGEENDFCRRAVKLGWRNVLCADVFVAHVGGVSFADEKTEKVENAQIQINRLHPEYDQCVQQHIQEDPAKAYRIKVLMELTAQSELPKVLFVTHQLGGGVEKHVFELCSYLDEQAISLKLILNGDGYFSLSFHWGELDKLIFRIPNENDDLVELLEKLGISHIHFHHTMGIDPVLWRLPDRLGVTLDYTLHDYYLINANPTLTDKNGLFCPEKKQRDMLGSSHYDIPGGISANDWRENQKILLNKCRHIFSPSQYAVNLFREYFPDYSPIVAYHPDYDLDYPYPDPQGLDHEDGRPLKILVLGAISREKGAHVLEETASTAVAKKLPLEFNLLGYAYRPLAKSVKIHGPYSDDNIDQLIKEIAPDIIWFPALWPETYSYTLSAALRNGLPVVVPDIGSFQERVRGRPMSWVRPWNSGPEEWVKFFMSLNKREKNVPLLQNTPWRNPNPYDYKKNYLTGIPSLSCKDFAIDLKFIRGHLSANSHDEILLSRKERLLLFLLKVRNWPGVKNVLCFVPYGTQRRIKRFFSRKPIHDLLKK